MRTSLRAGVIATGLCALPHGIGCASGDPRLQDDAHVRTPDSDQKGGSTDAGRHAGEARTDSGARTTSDASDDSGPSSSRAANTKDGMVAPPDAAVTRGEQDAAGDQVDCAGCSAYATPTQVGSVAPAELDALSGLAASRSQPDILFAHNDHERAVVYALDLQGRMHARIALQGAQATDLEDIAVGPCGAQSCVYLADIGDNAAQRSEYAILRFVEPTVPNTPGNTALTATFERYRFTYEDGSHNAESLMVAPDGTPYIVTKLASGSGGKVAATGPSSVYRLAALSTAMVARATRVATLTVPSDGELAASAAAAHPCGRGFLLRTYDKIYEFLTPASGDFEAAFRATPRVVAAEAEPQSEGIDYLADGRGFITSGEGSNAPLFTATCAR